MLWEFPFSVNTTFCLSVRLCLSNFGLETKNCPHLTPPASTARFSVMFESVSEAGNYRGLLLPLLGALFAGGIVTLLVLPGTNHAPGSSESIYQDPANPTLGSRMAPAPRRGNPAWGDCHRRPKMTKSGSRGTGTNSRRPSHSGGPPRLVGHPRRPRPRSRPHGVCWLPPLAEGRSERHTTAARSVQSPPQGPRNGYQDAA